jgi:hypothetical protein
MILRLTKNKPLLMKEIYLAIKNSILNWEEAF